MNSPAPSLLRRWLTLLMVGLLALGPFLHGHFGASHDTGFHLDGIHAVHALDATGMSAAQASEEESPALGVSASLPHQDDGLTLLGLALLMAVLLPLARRGPLRLPRGHGRVPSPAALYRPGFPPPGLPPPIA